MAIYGNDPDIASSPYYKGAVIGGIEVSGAGNIVLRCGELNEGGKSWNQTLHIVLTPDEAREVARQIMVGVEHGPTRQPIPQR